MKFHGRGAILVATALLSAPFPCVPAQSAQRKAAPALGRAPVFTRPSLNGEAIRLSRYRGKLVLLNFWATWCAPCVAEIPRFSAWQTKFGSQHFQVIGVSMDDDLAPVQNFSRRYQPAYPIVLGDEHLGELYGGVLGLPVTYLIGPEGNIITRYQGEADLKQMEDRIRMSLQSQRR